MTEFLSIYIHIPFCRKKCPYCDFLSFEGKARLFPEYQEALLQEMRTRTRSYISRAIKSIYFGGGTPTLFPPKFMVRIIQELGRIFATTDQAEISVEANPGTVSQGGLEVLLEGGVNRISLGIQSFNEVNLQRLGRIYNAQEVFQALKIIGSVGFSNFSLDLIFGIPGQDLENWRTDLIKAIDTGAPHISTYNLTIEEGTKYHALYSRGEMVLPTEDTQLEMYLMAREMLVNAGYSHYEISNFAKPHFKCQHNLTYWENREYLGLGAGAHSYLDQVRSANTKVLEEYITTIQNKGLAIEESETLDEIKRMGETIMLGLRLLDGISPEGFYERFGKRLEEVFSDSIKCLIAKDLINYNNRFKLTEKGIIFSNDVFREFI